MFLTRSENSLETANEFEFAAYERSLVQRQNIHDVDVQLASPGPINEAEIATMLDSIRHSLIRRFMPRRGRWGYFEEYINVAPWLDQRAEALAEEQLLLVSEISYVADEALALLHPYEKASHIGLLALRRHFGNFLRRWQSYENRETDLVYDALYEDIGAGD